MFCKVNKGLECHSQDIAEADSFHANNSHVDHSIDTTYLSLLLQTSSMSMALSARDA